MMSAGALDLLEGHRLADNAPKILQRAIVECDRILTGKVTEFIELVGGELLPRWQQRRVPKRRVERLRAIVLTAKALLKHQDLVSKRVGTPRGRVPDSTDVVDARYVCPPGQKKLCEETGLSITALRRAIKDLRLAGYLLGPGKGSPLKQRRIAYTNAKGEVGYSSCRVVYVLTDLFWQRLKLGDWLALEQRDAYERAKGRRLASGPLLAAREHRRAWKRGSRETRLQDAPGTPTPAVARTAAPVAPQAEDTARNLIQAQLALRKAHPEWDPDRVRAEALERLKRP